MTEPNPKSPDFATSAERLLNTISKTAEETLTRVAEGAEREAKALAPTIEALAESAGNVVARGMNRLNERLVEHNRRKRTP